MMKHLWKRNWIIIIIKNIFNCDSNIKQKSACYPNKNIESNERHDDFDSKWAKSRAKAAEQIERGSQQTTSSQILGWTQ